MPEVDTNEDGSGEYVGIKVVHAALVGPFNYSLDEDRPGYVVTYADGYRSWSPAAAFEENYVQVEPGTGAMLKAVAAMAIMQAIAGELPDEPEPDNDNPSNAEMGIVSDAMITGIAKVCHEVNREFQMFCGELPSPPWDAAPESQRTSSELGVRFAIDNPMATPASQHVAWLNARIEAGWTYGPVKSETEKTHPCLVPYSRLPREQQFKDKLFQAIVKSLVH